MKALSLSVFKKKFGLSTSQVGRLAQKGIIEIQQSGYPGDSKNHHKLVACKLDGLDMEELVSYLILLLHFT